jgi:predicted  nucleic acid-binding Zn-ribbon protein
MPDYIGKADCLQCDREGDVYTDRNGMAYMNCGPCGCRILQRTQRGNARFLAGVRRDAESDDGEKPAAPAPAPAVDAPPAPPANSGKTPEKKPKPSGFLSNSIFAGAR